MRIRCKVGLICGLIVALNLWMAVGLASAPAVSINVQNAELRDVLVSLAAVGNLNIVVDESVKGKISLNLIDVPLDQALDMVVKTRGFAYQKMADGTIVVADGKTLVAGYGSVTVFQLKYARAADAQKALAGVVADARLKADDISNSLVHFGSPAEAAQLRAAVNELDIPYQQVSVEAQVVEIRKSAAKNLGIEWSWANGPLQTGATGNENYENRGAISFGKAPNGQPYQFRYQAKINALVTKGDAKILAKPRVSTLTGKEAKIVIGDKIPVQKETIVDGKLETTVEYVETGIRLIYTPIINPDGMVRAHLLTEVSEPMAALGGKNYQIRTRTAETDLRMADGETVIIGGLLSSKRSHDGNKVPILGDLPLVGGLFRNIYNNSEETEIVVFLTAKISK